MEPLSIVAIMLGGACCLMGGIVFGITMRSVHDSKMAERKSPDEG